jgi:hypothetical protein
VSGRVVYEALPGRYVVQSRSTLDPVWRDVSSHMTLEEATRVAVEGSRNRYDRSGLEPLPSTHRVVDYGVVSP